MADVRVGATYGNSVTTPESARLIGLVGPKCGTENGYRAHKEAGGPIDWACRRAHAAVLRRRRALEAAKREATKQLIERHRGEFKGLVFAALQAQEKAVSGR